MTSFFLSSVFCVSVALMAGCSGPQDGADDSPIRGRLDKADLVGSCEGPNGSLCGGAGAGNCWCDDACAELGDCCSDVSSVCTSAASECESMGGSCFGGTVLCDAIEPGSENGNFDCEVGPGPHSQLTCCLPVENEVSECEAAGGSCFGGTLLCEAVQPGSQNGNLDCKVGAGPHPQLTCCLPVEEEVSECEAEGGTCIGGTVLCEAIQPTWENENFECEVGPGPYPQLTCCR